MKLGRRRFGLLTVLTALAGGRAFSAPVTVDRAALLATVAQSLFPHDEVSLSRYQEIAIAFLAASATQGERFATALGNERFLQLSPKQRADALRRMETSADFLVFRFHVMTRLYNDLALTRHFGYQGPSLAEGGYLHPGFGNISWLPDAAAVRNAD